MKVSCTYCHKIHDKNFECRQKKETIKINDRNKRNRFNKNNNEYVKFLNSKQWKAKRKEVYERDKGLCQCCIRDMEGTLYTYTVGQEVHHILKGKDNVKYRLDNNNLILLCKYHHELAEHKDISIKELKEIAKEQECKKDKE